MLMINLLPRTDKNSVFLCILRVFSPPLCVQIRLLSQFSTWSLSNNSKSLICIVILHHQWDRKMHLFLLPMANLHSCSNAKKLLLFAGQQLLPLLSEDVGHDSISWKGSLMCSGVTQTNT